MKQLDSANFAANHWNLMRTHPDQDPQHRLFFSTQVDGKLPADGVGPGGGSQGRLRISLQQADQLCLHQLARHARELFSPRVYPMGKAVNREDKRSRRYRDRDFAKFERTRRYRDR